MRGFINFIREQGVVGLAVGFILGGAISQVVNSIVTDIINPIVGLILGNTKGLETLYFKIFTAKVMFGHFLSILINFIIIACVVYFGVKGLGIHKLDKKKEEK